MKTNICSKLFQIPAIVFCILSFLQPGLSQQPNHYRIEAGIDPVNGEIEGRVYLSYVHPSGEPSVYVPIRTQNPTDYFHHDVIIHEVTDKNGTHLNLIPDEKERYFYKVAMNRSIRQGDSVDLVIHFTTSNIPDPYNYSIVQGIWHPKAVVFRHGYYCSVEEQADNYDVHLSIPEEYIVLSSGTTTKRFVSDNYQNIHLSAKNITGFGFVFSSDLVTTDLNVNDVKITAACTKDIEQDYLGLKQMAADVVEFYIETFGFYPQPQLVVLSGGESSTGGFPISSNMIVIHQPLLDYEPFARWIVAHEVGHQFWGFDYLIDSRKFCNWLGLGLGIYADRLFNQAMNPEGMYRINGFINEYMTGVRSGYNTTLMQNYKELSDIGFDWNNIISHGKAYTVIYLLEQIIGEEVFFDLTLHLLKNYRHKYLSIEDFQMEAEKISCTDLQWFFDDWVFADKVLDYRIDTIQKKDDNFTIIIDRVGQARLPLNVNILLANGERMAKEIEMESIKQEILIHSSNEPLHIQLDKRFAMLFPDEKTRQWHGVYRGLEIIEMQFPDLAWNINRFKMKIINNSNEPRKASVHIQTNTIDVSTGGYGRTINYRFEPGDTMCIEREIALRPVPGRHRIRISIKDVDLGYTAYNNTFDVYFPHKNSRINTFASDEYRFAVKNDYPAFNYEVQNNLIIYYLPDNEFLKENLTLIAHERKTALEHLSSLIYPQFADTVAIFLFPDNLSKLDLTGHQGMGWALPNQTIYEVYNKDDRVDIYHELVHIIAAKIGNPPAMLNEGHAVYYHEKQHWKGFHFDAWVKTYKKEETLIPLRTLLAFSEIGSPASKPSIAYPQSASVVNFLIDRYGYEHFLEVYKLITTEDIKAGMDLIDQKFKTVLGMNIDTIESEWLKYIEGIDIPPALID